ncbi:hypothetical protein [Pseudoalteromonas obscura]|uniref:Uncharacterized protein n=1 Tax=Pseudoalteromonas obscura TaxID=3048491 RepID=A0ABT7EHA6_9GAMM|nr:hypothetical protein [Pseudoalteromonas sp. P94(2023)]MDK2594433.1 hypothetical protein [Pseudoalteromonas sp. P94(2023)]
MEFRFPTAAAETNSAALRYLTKNLADPEAAKDNCRHVFEELGNSIESYPEWHPILTYPAREQEEPFHLISDLKAYKGVDHTVLFVKGFITCPYGEETAKNLIERVNSIQGLAAWKLDFPLYSDSAYPVLVKSVDIELEADGTIRSRDALAWCAQELVRNARNAQVAETWWNMKSEILGSPHGSRSSLIVNQHTGGHMRKILETLNNSGMYGPIKEWSLEMFSQKRRNTISETLIKAAISSWDGDAEPFTFELRDELCKAHIRDTFDDGHELRINVTIGKDDLCVSGWYYTESKQLQVDEPHGKRALAEKFL